MSSLDAGELRRPLSELTLARLDALEVLASIDSTNTHLLKRTAPAPGRLHIAIADEQTSGRGRHSRRWVSPPGAGVYLSLAYTFAQAPRHLPALTLALGVGVATVLEGLGSGAVQLKWPNDVIVGDGKLGGILTEVQSRTGEPTTVVTGVGLNIELPETVDPAGDSKWALRPVDLHSIVDPTPSRERLAGLLIESLFRTMVQFEESGFDAFVDDWRRRDWLKGRQLVVESPGSEITGIAAGVGSDGALIIDGSGGRMRIASGSVTKVGGTESRA